MVYFQFLKGEYLPVISYIDYENLIFLTLGNNDINLVCQYWMFQRKHIL